MILRKYKVTYNSTLGVKQEIFKASTIDVVYGVLILYIGSYMVRAFALNCWSYVEETAEGG